LLIVKDSLEKLLMWKGNGEAEPDEEMETEEFNTMEVGPKSPNENDLLLLNYTPTPAPAEHETTFSDTTTLVAAATSSPAMPTNSSKNLDTMDKVGILNELKYTYLVSYHYICSVLFVCLACSNWLAPSYALGFSSEHNNVCIFYISDNYDELTG
jgi:hypothetical protein